MKPLIRLLTLLAGFCALPAQAQPQGPYPPDGAYAPPGAENVSFAYADVLRTEPVFEIFRNPNPREECYDERVVTQKPDGGDPTGGTVLGAAIGGVLGNQVGGGSGRTAATVAGARRAFAVIRENLAWAAVYNVVAIPAAAFGLVTPVWAAVGMSVSSLAVVANALRLTRVPAEPGHAAPAGSPGAASALGSAWKS